MEYINNIQKKQFREASIDNKSKSKQLRSFSDKRAITQQQAKQISFMHTLSVLQRYVTGSVSAPGHVTANIVNPVGVAPLSANPMLQRCHLVANRFGGPPGGDNIVYMSALSNQAMYRDENTVYNYMAANPTCVVQYDSNTVGYAANNTALGATITAFDISVVPNIQIV